MGAAIDPRKLLAEAIGVFTLVFAGAGSIVLSVGNAGIGLVEIALAHGLAIGLMVLALGYISGGHFNPAVTAGFWVTRRIGSLEAAGYVLSQLVGGIVAAVLLVLLFPEGLRDASNLGTPALGPGIEFAQGVGIEAVLTFFLVLVIFGTAVDRRGPNMVAGLAIGLSITMGILAAGPLTGAALNPARAVGPALLTGDWTSHLVWWIGPIIGGVLAALLYHYVFAEPPEVVEETTAL
ncbi:MAG: aquaporin [Dehalococcoidia bacterium]|nr:aquaporin [Dehalococcoidia bacterium]